MNEDSTRSAAAIAALRDDIRQRRKSLNLSHADMARKTVYSREYICMVEKHGSNMPSANVVKAIDVALQANGELIEAHAKARASARQAKEAIKQGCQPVGTAAQRGQTSDIAEAALAQAASAARQFRSFEMTSNEFVEAVHQEVRDLAVSYPAQPLEQVLPELVKNQELIFSLLEKPQRPRQAADLYFLGAVTGGMLAKAAHDQGNPTSALSIARTASLCADHSGSSGLRAWIFGLQALVAYWAGNPRESIRYIQLGSEHAEAAHNSTLPWLAVSEARAWARLGNSARAHECIRRAEASRPLIQTDELDALGGIAEFSHARQHYFSAEALSWLPNDPSAVSYAQTAVAVYSDESSPHWAFGDAAGSRAALSLAYLGENGDQEAASESLGPVLQLPQSMRINGVVQATRRVRDAVSTQAKIGKAGEALQARIETFCNTSSALEVEK